MYCNVSIEMAVSFYFFLTILHFAIRGHQKTKNKFPLSSYEPNGVHATSIMTQLYVCKCVEGLS
uniref:Uncharacterized protein n=1 Tax=Anguilla anguilla TaxID=7936 RepID=A0A0E9VJW6_ANGAN